MFDRNIPEFQRELQAKKEKIAIFDSTTFMIPYVQTIFENSPDLKITIIGRLQINDELLIQPGMKGLCQGQSGYFYGLLTDRET